MAILTFYAFLKTDTVAGPCRWRTSGALAPTFSLALSHRHVFLRISGADVIGAWTDQAIVVELLDNVGNPAADSRHGKYRSEQVYVNPQGVVGGCGVEVDVGIELLLGLHKFFNLVRHLEPFALATALAQIAGHLAQVRGPRVFGVIDAVAEPRNFLFLSQHAFDVDHWISAGLIDGL